MTAVWYDTRCDQIWIESHEEPFAPRTLVTLVDAQGFIHIRRPGQSKTLAGGSYADFTDEQGRGFASNGEALAYLNEVFDIRAATEAPPAEAVAPAGALAGQPMAVSRLNGELVPARGDTYPLALVAGLAASAASAGYVASLTREALTLADWTAIAGTPSLSLGLPYFLGPEGGLTLAPEMRAGAGYSNVRLGVATGPQTFAPSIADPILL